ncbi:MAG: acyl-CoA dehydrogenase C-terminal domain-containing protein [Paracoccaceae bacterium]|nr:acyl-CoA dehydrogenase C-terminal domain-containing protein [Paracoccaceae bacterium]
MHTYQPPVKDFMFILYDLFQINEKHSDIFADYSKDMVEPILIEAGRLASEVILPTNKAGDIEGCTLESGKVKTPNSFKEAFNKIASGEWPSLNCDPEFGGQGIPLTIATAVGEFFGSANVALYIYHVLSHGVYSTIKAHGTSKQKSTFLPNLVKSKWTGTMNLTEPQCGTDLAMIKTRAVPSINDSYKISGQKIYISAGDHDLAENIIHLVLAKIPGSPDGVKGISLFIVPKFIVSPNGEILNPNNVSVGKVERKMGIHGNATCVMNYDEATGYLLGLENKGLSCMFTMMNEARHAVGMQGLSQAEIAYQYANQHAKDRVQGKPIVLTDRDTKRNNDTQTSDTIICHPDIRRMLLEQKSFIEGARAFAIWSSLLIDKGNYSNDEDAKGLVSLLIPIFKAFLSDKGFESTVIAQQVLGGQGYVEDSEMSQFVRDARIAMIYEGTNGIQAIDLIGRKLTASGGKYVVNFIREVKSFINNSSNDEIFKTDFVTPLNSALDDLEKSLDYLSKYGLADPNNALSGASDFLHLFGHVILGYLWSQIGKKSLTRINENRDVDFYQAKFETGKFYMKRSLPETKLRLARVLSGKDSVMNINQDRF